MVDGDTITVDRGRPIRLVGFNAPEIRNHAECAADRKKGKGATRRMRELVATGGLDLTFVRCACSAVSQARRAAITAGAARSFVFEERTLAECLSPRAWRYRLCVARAAAHGRRGRALEACAAG